MPILKCRKYICQKSAWELCANFVNWFGGLGQRPNARGLISKLFTFGYKNRKGSKIRPNECKHREYSYDPLVKLLISDAEPFEYIPDDACIYCAVNMIIDSLHIKDNPHFKTGALIKETIRLIPIYHPQKKDCLRKNCQTCLLRRDLTTVLYTADNYYDSVITWDNLEEMGISENKEECGYYLIDQRLEGYIKERKRIIKNWGNEDDRPWAIKPLWLDMKVKQEKKNND